MTARSLLVALFFALLLNAKPVLAGTPDEPEVTDAAGDTDLPQLDIAAVWFEATDTELLVHIARNEGAEAPPPVVQCAEGQCVGASTMLRAVFAVLKPEGTAASSIEGYAASYVTVRVGVEDAAVAANVGTMDAEGGFTAAGPANVTVNGLEAVVTVPRAHEAIGLPEGPAPGAYRITQTWAYSAPMICAPDGGQGAQGLPAGCPTLLTQPDQTQEWDRAPDADFGLDFVFAEPAEDEPVVEEVAKEELTAPVSTTTMTVTQVETQTFTHAVTETVTYTVAPAAVAEQESPGAGLLVAVLLAGLAFAVRARIR